jgi:hypothetical protein
MRKKLTLDRETVRAVLVSDLHQARGGDSGLPCDGTTVKTACVAAGCNLCPETMGACDSLAFTCFNTCTA